MPAPNPGPVARGWVHKAEVVAAAKRAGSLAAIHQARSSRRALVVVAAATAFPVPKVARLWFRVWARECWDPSSDLSAESTPGSTAFHRPSKSSAMVPQTVFYIE